MLMEPFECILFPVNWCVFKDSGLEKESVFEFPDLNFVRNLNAGGFYLLEKGGGRQQMERHPASFSLSTLGVVCR